MILSLQDMATIATALRQQGKTIALTNGTFDLVHAGHVRYLNEATKLADYLIVGINSDSSVKQYKSDKRPIIPQQHRAELIDSLKAVDFVVIFPETTATTLLQTIKPEIYVKGGDYTEDSLPETPAVHAYGGQIQFIQMVDGCSTTNIIRKILTVYPELIEGNS